jgi:predicted RecB family nuclease
MGEQPYTVRVTEIGEFIHHKLCERRFKLGFNNRAEARRVPFAVRLFNPIDPVLQAAGRSKEDQLAQELLEADYVHVTNQHYHPENLPDPQYPTWDDFLRALATIEAGQAGFAREVQIQGNIGRFIVQGRIDFILFLWRDGRPILRVVEAKSSRKDRTYHRIQVALYRMIVRQMLHENPVSIHGQPIDPDETECTVVRIDEQNRMQSILNAPPLEDVSQEETDIDRLLSDEGPLVRIVNTPLNELSYKLEAS